MNLREFISLGYESLHPALEVIAWSLNALATGIHPSTDYQGNPYRGRYVAGTQIAGWMGEGDLTAKMVTLCNRFKNWASANRLQHSQAMMTGGLLSWEGGAFPRLDLKAWNSRLMTAFFHIVLRQLQDQAFSDESLHKEIRLAFGLTNAMITFIDTMERSPRYLTSQQAQVMHSACSTYLQLSEVIALVAQQRDRARWKVDFVGFWKTLVQAVPKELLEFRCLTR
ncbi:unnamed protein product, partial [Symbiodinium sp. CCMP2592]